MTVPEVAIGYWKQTFTDAENRVRRINTLYI